MKKTFLYAFAAIVLGVTIMLFPLWTFFKTYGEEGPILLSSDTAPQLPQIKPMWASENWENYTRTRMEQIPKFGEYDVLPQPADSSLQMLAVGFIAAMIVYVIVRRRVPRPTSMYRFPPI